MNRRAVMVGAVSSVVALSGCVDDVARGIEGSDNDHPIDGLEGAIGEEEEEVILPYKDYSGDEADSVREEAVEFEYDSMFREIEDHKGDAVYTTGIIQQVIENEDHKALFIAVDDGSIYASWTGERFLEGDRIEFWGEIIGDERYITGLGSENTVPSIAIAGIELLEESG